MEKQVLTLATRGDRLVEHPAMRRASAPMAKMRPPKMMESRNTGEEQLEEEVFTRKTPSSEVCCKKIQCISKCII